MNTQRGFLFRPVQLHGQHLIQNMKIASVNLTGISDDDYSEYMEVLNQEGFSVIENVSEEIEEGNYVSIGTLLSNEDKWLSISYIPDSLTIYISFDNN